MKNGKLSRSVPCVSVCSGVCVIDILMQHLLPPLWMFLEKMNYDLVIFTEIVECFLREFKEDQNSTVSVRVGTVSSRPSVGRAFCLKFRGFLAKF